MNLGLLPAGNYDVRWNVRDFGIPRPEAGGEFRFVVGAAAAADIPAVGGPILALLALALATAGALASRHV